MSMALLRFLLLGVAALCIIGVVVGVVATGRDVDFLAVAALAALVLDWRLHGRRRRRALGG